MQLAGKLHIYDGTAMRQFVVSATGGVRCGCVRQRAPFVGSSLRCSIESSCIDSAKQLRPVASPNGAASDADPPATTSPSLPRAAARGARRGARQPEAPAEPLREPSREGARRGSSSGADARAADDSDADDEALAAAGPGRRGRPRAKGTTLEKPAKTASTA